MAIPPNGSYAKVFPINPPQSVPQITLSSGVNIVALTSGQSNIGSASLPLATGYFNNIVSPITAKAWFRYNGVTNTLIRSYNISSVIRNSLGNYTAFFNANTFHDGNYCSIWGGTMAGVTNNSWLNAVNIIGASGDNFNWNYLGDAPNGTVTDQTIACWVFFDL